MHDIGKIGIPDGILSKKDALTDEEYEIMKQHVEGSIAMIRYLPSLDYVIPSAIGHHERWDGKGYPRGIAGEAIPIGARCLCIADSFDAMVTRRSYKSAMSVADALQEIRRNLGTQFDPQLGQLFIRLVEEGKITPHLS
ncbi:Cyclic di-GMP phosphodiesterase [bioreactor metagenome]|uniref:Cyclic di-GMP phosphodiesterase n=1 Tax=bioreactor metagenome TaxID=1076179 RepID=A0A645JHF2_9ZZZZ